MPSLPAPSVLHVAVRCSDGFLVGGGKPVWLVGGGESWRVDFGWGHWRGLVRDGMGPHRVVYSPVSTQRRGQPVEVDVHLASSPTSSRPKHNNPLSFIHLSSSDTSQSPSALWRRVSGTSSSLVELVRSSEPTSCGEYLGFVVSLGYRGSLCSISVHLDDLILASSGSL